MVVAGLLALAAGTAAAQSRAVMLGGVAPASPVKDAPDKADGFTEGGAEPRHLAGMLQRQNEIRHRARAPELSWSVELAKRVQETMEASTQPVCSVSASRNVALANGYAIHWLAPLRRVDGSVIPRDVTAPYIVSDWAAGQGDYDAARERCRRGGACDSYRAMISSKAKLVGCARVTCGNGAQIFACGYAPALKPR